MAWNSGTSLKGQRGAQILFGARNPTSTDGFDGDGWIRTDTGQLFAQKANGVWPATYASLVGPAGSSWSAGNGQPSDAIGQNGDWFLRLDTRQLLQKANGSWPTTGTTQYNVLTVQPAVPAANAGNVGDQVFTVSNGITSLYVKSDNTTWSLVSTLTGPKGDRGDVGAASTVAGPSGTSWSAGQGQPPDSFGNPGDWYLNLISRQLIKKGATSWPTTGFTQYNVISVQSAVPAASAGNIGDMVFVISNGATLLYTKTDASTWSLTSNLQGPAGSKGDVGPAGSVPNDLAPNSVAIAPVSGDTTAVSLSLASSSGKLFTVDASGNTVVSGTLKASGATSLAGLTASGSSTLASVSASGAASLGSTLNVTGATTLAGLTASGATNLGSTLSVTGATTAAALTSSATVQAKNLTLTSGGGGSLTFADGTTQTTAATTSSGSGTGSSSYRQTVKGFIWQAVSANTAYAVNVPLTMSSSGGYGVIPLREPALAAGTLTGLLLTCPGSVGSASVTINVLKNGTSIWTATSAITTTNTSTPTEATAKPSSTISFAANDVLTMTGTWSAQTNTACLYVTLAYTLSA